MSDTNPQIVIRRKQELQSFNNEQLAARLYQHNPFGGYRVKDVANLRNGVLNKEMAVDTILRYEFGPSAPKLASGEVLNDSECGGEASTPAHRENCHQCALEYALWQKD